MSVFIIAEIGVNHDGNFCRALDLIDAAVAAGANAVKFQAFTAEVLDPPGARRDMLRSLEFSPAEFLRLQEHCAQRNIEFMATPFDVEWLKFLHDHGMRRLKIASSSITNMELLRAAAKLGWEHVYMSVGAATLDEMIDALRVFAQQRYFANFSLLHCVSSYPTELRDCRLLLMRDLRERWGDHVGFSSHCPEIWPAVAAAALGAAVIEQHITFDREAPGPDHASSLTSEEFKLMVSAVHAVKTAVGVRTKSNPDCELTVLNIRKERDAWRATCSATAATGD